MSTKLQIVIAIIDIVSVIYIGNMVRKRKVELKYTLVWFLVAFCYSYLIFFHHY